MRGFSSLALAMTLACLARTTTRVMAQVCDDINTFSGSADCLDTGSCNSGVFTVLTLVVVDEVCDGSPDRDSITLTGSLDFFFGGRNFFDVGIWTGPFANTYCTRHGFECEDSDPEFLTDGDTCLDMALPFADLRGVEVTVPCKGDDEGSLLLDYCFTWKTEGDDNTECTSINGIDPSPENACSCFQQTFTGIKVCPAQTDLNVTSSTSSPVCLGDGVNVQIDISGIPTGAMFVYVIEDENEGHVQGGFMYTASTIEVFLYPDIGYTIDVTVSSLGLICKTLSFDLEPICSCSDDDDCGCTSSPDCLLSGLICFSQTNVCGEPSCPAQTDLNVTWTTSSPPCLGDGVDVQIDISGIPTDAVFEYVIEDEGGNEVVSDDNLDTSSTTVVTSEDDLGATTPIEVVLKPDIGYTIDVTASFPGVGLDCVTLSFDLAPPFCSCSENDECGCTSPSGSPSDTDCLPIGLICCSQRNVCDFPSTGEDGGTACGDPHMTGFLGQKFDFTGEDGGWYSIIADSNMNVNMRVTSPVADLPEITYITGLSVLTTDAEGFNHSIVIEVAHPHSLDSCCPAGVWPCLADGALRVFLDGDEALFAPGTVSLGPHVGISAANLPGACRSFGFEKYWERKKLEYASHGRRLGSELSMGEWILGDPTATNMDECLEYVAQAEVEEGGVFAHQSEHASFQIVTPEATIRLSHGRLHQIAMRDPTDQFDLPDHLTWQMNMAVDHNDVSRAAKGVLGETFVATRDASGRPIMAGIEAIRGKEEDYRVEGPLGMDFVQGAHAS